MLNFDAAAGASAAGCAKPGEQHAVNEFLAGDALRGCWRCPEKVERAEADGSKEDMKKEKKKGKDKKEKKEAGLGRQKQMFDTNAGKELAEKSGLTVVNSFSKRGDREDAENVKKL